MRTTLTCWFVAFAFAHAALAQEGVRLTKVPERVVLPAAAGQNLIVEVEIQGQPSEVWLACDAAAVDRVPLAKASAHGWQLNLADAAVARLLPADRNLGDLHVFARLDGKVLQSAAIAWARAQPTARVSCVVVGVDGKRSSSSVDERPWLDPAAVECVEIRGLAMLQAKASAIAGSTTLPLSRTVAEPFTLVMNDGLEQALWQSGELGIDVEHGQQSWWFGFRVVPDRLEPEDPTFSVLQRKRGPVPGSNGWLEVRLDDITQGQVLLAVVDADGRDVVTQRSVGEGDHVTVRLAAGDYVLVVDRLVNRLIGDDHAELRVLPAKRFEPDPIALLIERVGKDEGIAFVREGQDYDGEMAQRFLRARRQLLRERQLTPLQFVEQASKSSRTGEPYHIRTADGKVVTAAEWFTGQLAEIRREEALKEKARKEKVPQDRSGKGERPK